MIIEIVYLINLKQGDEMPQLFKIEINTSEINANNIEIAYHLMSCKQNTIEKDGSIKWSKDVFEDSVIYFKEIPESWLVLVLEASDSEKWLMSHIGMDHIPPDYKKIFDKWVNPAWEASRIKLDLDLKEIISTFRYRINNPSAWQEYSEEGSEVLRDFINQLEKL